MKHLKSFAKYSKKKKMSEAEKKKSKEFDEKPEHVKKGLISRELAKFSNKFEFV